MNLLDTIAYIVASAIIIGLSTGFLFQLANYGW